MSLNERFARIYLRLGEAFRAEAFADHIVGVAADRDACGDADTADALRVMARAYRVRALAIWGDIASLNAVEALSNRGDT